MTNFFDEITSFFTILSEDRERLLAAPILDMQENKNIFRSDQSVSGFIFSTKEKQMILLNNIKKMHTKNMEYSKLIRLMIFMN